AVAGGVLDCADAGGKPGGGSAGATFFCAKTQVASKPANAANAARRKKLIRQRIEVVHRMQQRAGTSQRRQPALEDGVDFAALVDAHQGTVYREPKVGIVAAQNDAIRFVRKIR